MEKVTREQAIEQGLKKFFPKEPCARGHVAIRYLYGRRSMCSECVKENSKKRMARIYSNPEEHEAFNAQQRGKRKAFYYRHRERLNEERRDKWANDEGFRNKMKAMQADYIKRTEYYNSETRKRWLDNNKDKLSEYGKRSRERHAGSAKYLGYLYRRRKRAAMPAWTDRDAIKAMYAKMARMNRLAGRDKPGLCAFHVDHIIPLHNDNVCGLHVPENLRIVRASDNIRKSNKWETENGRQENTR